MAKFIEFRDINWGKPEESPIHIINIDQIEEIAQIPGMPECVKVMYGRDRSITAKMTINEAKDRLWPMFEE